MKTFIEYLNERKLSDTELKYRERYVKKLKPKLKDFQKRYGKKDGKSVMYAVATRTKNEKVQRVS